MATIPRSQGPRVMPGRGPTPQPTAEAFGAGTGRALEQLGGTAVQAGMNVLQEQRIEQKRAEEEQRRLAEAAERARELDQLNKTQDALTDARDELAEGIRSGTVDKTKAESLWAEQSSKIVGEAMPGFRDQTKPLVQGQIDRLAMRFGNELRKDVAKRDRQDVTAGIEQTLEFTQRLYKTDPAAAEKQAMATLDQLGQFSLYTPEQIAAKKQAWKEGTQFNLAYEAISAGRNNRQALDEASALLGRLPDLDPQRRAQLADRADAYRMHLDQKAELAAQRAQREAERRLTKAEAEFNTFQALADKGTALAPEYIDRALAATAGTPYQAGIKAMAEQAKETGGLAAQPVRTQQATLDAIDRQIAQHGRTPELTKRREQVAKVAQGSEKDIDADALRAGLERGVITEIRPLDLSGGVAGLAQQVQQRVQAAERVGAWAGRPVSPLTSDESMAISKMFGAMKSDDKANAVFLLAQQVPGPQMQALARQIAPKDRTLYLAMSAGSGQTSAGLPAARLIFMGQEFLRNEGKSESKIPPAEIKRASEAVGDMFGGDVREDIVEATALIQLGKKMDGQSASVRKSLEIALGGPILQHAGKQIPAAPGMTLDRFREALPVAGRAALAKLPDGKVYTTGGDAIDSKEFLADLPMSQLQPAGEGRYYVRVGMGVAVNAKGDKIVLEVR